MGTLIALFNQNHCEGYVLDKIVQDLVHNFFLNLKGHRNYVSFSGILSAKISYKAISY